MYSSMPHAPTKCSRTQKQQARRFEAAGLAPTTAILTFFPSPVAIRYCTVLYCTVLYFALFGLDAIGNFCQVTFEASWPTQRWKQVPPILQSPRRGTMLKGSSANRNIRNHSNTGNNSNNCHHHNQNNTNLPGRSNKKPREDDRPAMRM